MFIIHKISLHKKIREALKFGKFLSFRNSFKPNSSAIISYSDRGTKKIKTEKYKNMRECIAKKYYEHAFFLIREACKMEGQKITTREAIVGYLRNTLPEVDCKFPRIDTSYRHDNIKCLLHGKECKEPPWAKLVLAFLRTKKERGLFKELKYSMELAKKAITASRAMKHKLFLFQQGREQPTRVRAKPSDRNEIERSAIGRCAISIIRYLFIPCIQKLPGKEKNDIIHNGCGRIPDRKKALKWLLGEIPAGYHLVPYDRPNSPLVQRTGKGVKGDPYLYSLIPFNKLSEPDKYYLLYCVDPILKELSRIATG